MTIIPQNPSFTELKLFLLMTLHDLSNNTYLGLEPNLETNDFFATIKFEYVDSWKVSTMNMFQYPLGMKKN